MADDPAGREAVAVPAVHDDPIEAYFEAASALLGLPILPEHREEALAAFKVLRQHAAVVTDFALPDDTEAAPRFKP